MICYYGPSIFFILGLSLIVHDLGIPSIFPYHTLPLCTLNYVQNVGIHNHIRDSLSYNGQGFGVICLCFTF